MVWFLCYDRDALVLISRIRGGVVEEKCGELINEEAVRVVYKNNYSFGVKLFNIYMVWS